MISFFSSPTKLIFFTYNAYSLVEFFKINVIDF